MWRLRARIKRGVNWDWEQVEAGDCEAKNRFLWVAACGQALQASSFVENVMQHVKTRLKSQFFIFKNFCFLKLQTF